LREYKNAPYYHCHDHGVNISSDKGVYAKLAEYAKQNNIHYGGDHFYSEEKKLDELHFTRNIAEDSYNYLVFIRNNSKFNLTPRQQSILDSAINQYHEICETALSDHISLDFTESNTPSYSDNNHENYNDSLCVFYDLISVIETAIEDSEFYETCDFDTIAEETTKYNEEYKKMLEENPEYSRVPYFKSENIASQE